MKILSIETSCDETGAAILDAKSEHEIILLANILATSMEVHATTGGVIPEIAARHQSNYMLPVVWDALQTAKLKPEDLDAIAVTYGPGLIGSLLVGVETAKTLSYIWNKQLIPVNHLFGHLYANWIGEKYIPLPAVALIVSGGHTDLLLLKSHEDITFLGGTRDDAAGECFDKSARLLGYAYPGGPKIAQLAQQGDENAFVFPRPLIGSHDYDFSFSGLKTAFLNETRKYFPLLRKTTTQAHVGWQEVALESQLSEREKQTLYDLCASLEKTIVSVLIKKTLQAVETFGAQAVILSGGVAANEKLRETLLETLEKSATNIPLFVPEKFLCTDNAAMIGAAAYFTKERAGWQTLTANPELYFD